MDEQTNMISVNFVYILQGTHNTVVAATGKSTYMGFLLVYLNIYRIMTGRGKLK
jgi:hypothetical protein